ncbi:hypothetical protein A2468_01280 [Candidatus Falkowbacteria bacterium RIFOXYC2_FULL_46_15]|uniref:Uncharacterized protein n=1 Tax=Candidatus Falkowbacteria bacterium RIFOXYA2_FULL_47_19 TaxID=1797994 RepID=A0A1F5SK31_9BACT|nr:MAG: hypothetical protein A2227_04340 [Candidatus Falkowbacteria bacterium RIFOXYA2_FULL_47_19]OGF36989.1 MAG: hypothetical protein A2468_01280 [Candidatus Falkowbacteria bacterium RIFOXYC2_FULL_46_15]
MKRGFNSFFLIINKEKKGLKFGSEENFTPYYHYKGNFLEPLIAVLYDVRICPPLLAGNGCPEILLQNFFQ